MRNISLLNTKYPDRGGYFAFSTIYESDSKYEDKLDEIRKRYLVSYDTAKNWYAREKADREHATGQVSSQPND